MASQGSLGAILFGLESDPRNNEDFEKYLYELTSFSLQKLKEEPSMLEFELQETRAKMQTMAFENYKGFIDTSDAVHSIEEQVLRIDNRLESMGSNLNDLSTACESLSANWARELNSKRAANKVTLRHHHALLELLELPQLMEISVRSNSYEAALQLDTFVSDLKKKYSNIPIVQQIVSETSTHTQVLLRQLLDQLKSPIQLPDCLRIIGYLKRLAFYEDDHQLRTEFLQSRNEWLEGVLSRLSASNTQNYLKEYIEVSRTHIFDIITQYRAIFSDENQEDANLLFSWIHKKVSSFLAILGKDLPSVLDGLGLSVLLEQSMYYGMSLGRIGLDFRALLIPYFERQIVLLFTKLINTATDRFLSALPSAKHKSHTTPAISSIKTSQFSPPTTLLDFPALGQLLNGYLGAFNELRHTTAPSLCTTLEGVLSESVNRVVIAIKSAKLEIVEEEETKNFARFQSAAANDLLPHIITCFTAMFPASRLRVEPFQNQLLARFSVS